MIKKLMMMMMMMPRFFSLVVLMDPRASKPGHLLGDALETDSKEIKKNLCQIRLTDFLRSILVCRLRAIGFLLSLLHYLESSGFHDFL